MIHKSSDGLNIGRKALRVGMSVTELPIMALLGYLVGRSIEREIEGAILGVVIGFILLIVSIRPALKSSNLGIS